MTSGVDKAIKLAENFGWRVFPANPKNKRPLISGWQDKAASDPEEIEKLFRYSLRDRLKVVECPADIIDAIGGWTTEGVGHQYSKGHSLNVKARWMHKLTNSCPYRQHYNTKQTQGHKYINAPLHCIS